MKVAVYPGSFDPFTLGHLDIVERSSHLFDQVIIAIGKSSTKTGLFGDDEKVELIQAATKGMAGVKVEKFGGLVADFARGVKAAALIRGIRSVSDFTYEMQMAVMNRHLASGIETIFVPTHQELSHISATLVKDIASHGGNIASLVPKEVIEPLRKKFAVSP